MRSGRPDLVPARSLGICIKALARTRPPPPQSPSVPVGQGVACLLTQCKDSHSSLTCGDVLL